MRVLFSIILFFINKLIAIYLKSILVWSSINVFSKTTVFRILDILKKDNISAITPPLKIFFRCKSFRVRCQRIDEYIFSWYINSFFKKIAAKLNETCFLAVYHDGSVIYLYKAEGELAVKTNSHIGSRMPVYCTGQGKSLLAYQPLVEINKVLSRPLVQFTSKTIVDREAIHNSLAKVCIDGYSMDDEEVEEGLTCIAGSSFRIIQKKELIINELKNIRYAVTLFKILKCFDFDKK